LSQARAASGDGGEAGLRPVAALLVGIFLANAGSGPLSSLLGLRLAEAAMARPLIGAVMASFFAGLTLGSLFAYRVVLQAGHIRAFAVFASVVSAVALAYPFAAHPLAWAMLRLAEGFCMAGIFICVESWLNARATPGTRGKLLAAYMVCLYLGQAAGQFLLHLEAADAEAARGNQAFAAASILLSLAVVPVALTRLGPPVLPDVAAFSPRRLYAASPLGVVGTVASGLVLGALQSLAPVFARGIGLGIGEVALFMSTLLCGGVALQWPLGWLSDAFDRRRVILLVLAGLVLTALAMPWAARPGGPVLLAAAALFGGFAFALYPLCVAHTNDHLAREERIAASGGLVLAYSAGAIAGPLGASTAMSGLGPVGLFAFAGAVAAAGLGFGLWRLAVRGPVPAEQQGPFQPLTRTTPAAAPLDPRASTPE
jgi:MFS family permease